MKSNICILGTSHPVQCGCSDAPIGQVEAFTNEVKRLVEKYKISRIAEEMSLDGLNRLKVSDTIAQRIAIERSLEYQSVDLGNEERANLSLTESTVLQAMNSFGVSDGKYLMSIFDDLTHEVRERVWVARVLAGKGWPVLFICGARHSIPVERLFRAAGLSAHSEHIDFQNTAIPVKKSMRKRHGTKVSKK